MDMPCTALPATQPKPGVGGFVMANRDYPGREPMLRSPSQGWGEIWAGLWLSSPVPSLHLWPRTLLFGECCQLPGMLGALGAACPA